MNFKLLIYGVILVNSITHLGAVFSKNNNCKKQRKFTGKLYEKGSKERLINMSIMCTVSEVIFEVRYSNGSLCTCGYLQKASYRTPQIKCQEQLASLDIIVNVSTNTKKSSHKERCDIYLRFYPATDRDFSQRQISILREKKVKHSTPAVSKSLQPTVDRTTLNDEMTSHNVKPTSYLTTRLRSQAPPPTDQETSSKILKSSPVESPASQSSVVIPSINNTPRLLTMNPSPTPVFPILHQSAPKSMVLPTPVQKSTKSIHHTSVRAINSQPPVLVISSRNENEELRTTNTVIQASSTKANILPTSRLSPNEEKQKKFEEDLQFIDHFNPHVVKIDDRKAIERVLDAATNLITTNQTLGKRKQDPGMQAVEVLQDLGNSLSKQLDLGNKSSVMFQEETKDLVFGAAVINTTSSKTFSFPSENEIVTSDEKITIPNSVFNSNKSGRAYFVGIIFKPYQEMKSNTGDLKLGTKVINAIISPPPKEHLKEPVVMLFKKTLRTKNFGSECSFWIENSSLSGEHGRWSTRQCFRTFENRSHIKCKCYHFTHFAVLFKISSDQDISEEHKYSLAIITYIGLSLSILGCILTFIIYVTLQNIKSERAIIHANLVLALGIADLIFLITIAVKPVKSSCSASAMLVFYFYLAVFFWMLVEGVYIYLMVTKVFRGDVARRRRLAYLVGWGCPLLIAILTWAVLRDDVISKYHCWLSVETGAIWAFVVPGLTIILINCVIILAVIKITWATFSDKAEYSGLKSASKTFGAVIPILGITWMFGVMAFNDSSIIFQYIFAITNSIQGALIFILYCLVNLEVRKELLHRFSVWRTRREMTSSSTGRRILMSSQSAKGTQESSQDPPQELKKQNSGERSSLLDDVFTPETSTGMETNDNSRSKAGGCDSPVKNNTIVDNSFNSIGYV